MSVPDLWRFALRTVRPAAAAVPDAELLARFRDAGDEAAFELLLYRHGPMVWAACRRQLADAHAAEDAFQAVFLALARKAASVHRAPSVAAWLHRVAVRAARHLGRACKPTTPADLTAIDPRPGPPDRAAAAELAARLDTAIDRLPDRLRRVFVACELQGDSLADVAARLGCPVGTVASRLARARERLRDMLPLGGLAGAPLAGSAEPVPAAVRLAALRAIGGTEVRPGVAELAVRASRPAGSVVIVSLAGSLAVGLVAVTLALGGPDPTDPASKPPVKDPPPAKDPPPVAAAVRTDAEGVPLPDGAVARLGSSRFRFGGTTDTTPFVPAAAFSPDGKLLAVGSGSGLTVLDVASGRPVHWFPAADRQDVQLVWFVAAGRRLAVGATGPKGGLTIYDLATGKPAGAWALPGEGWFTFGHFTPDGTRVLYADARGTIRLWDLATRAEVWSFPYGGVLGSALRITADGKHVVLGRRNGKPELRDAPTGQPAGPFPDPGPGFERGNRATASPDGRLAVAADAGEAVAVLAASGADRVRRPASRQAAYGFAFSPDGRYLVGLGTQVWDLKEKDDRGPVARLPSASSAAFSADGRTLALAGDGCVTFWSVGDWKRKPQGPEPAASVRRVWFTRNGERVLGYTRAGWLSWPAAGGPVTRLSDDAPGHPGALAGMSADGRVLADVLADPVRHDPRKAAGIRVIDRATGGVRRLSLEGADYKPVQVSPDGKYVSSVMPDQTIRAWDAGTGRVVFEQPRADDYAMLDYQMAPDGRGLALSLRGIRHRGGPGKPGGPSYAAVTLTDHRSGRTRPLDPMPWAVFVGGCRFTQDGTRLVLHANYDDRFDGGSVAVWDVRTVRRLVNWETKGDGYVHAFAAAPDARSLLVGDSKGTLTCVEVATGGERAVFRHHSPIDSAAVSPDGTRVVASSREAPVYVWDLVGNAGPWNPTAVWESLAAKDAKTAFAAIRNLRAHPAEAVAFLKDRVKVPAPPADETLARWLKDLDSPRFAVREQAQRELTSAADLIRPKLRAARKTASEEAGRRLDQVLTAAEALTAENLRQIRACEVLEGLGTPAALAVLKGWAAGPAGARLTTEAAASVGRHRP